MMATNQQCKRCGGPMEFQPYVDAPEGIDAGGAVSPRDGAVASRDARHRTLRFHCPRCGGRTATRRLARARFVGREFGRWHEFHIGRAPTPPDASTPGDAPAPADR